MPLRSNIYLLPDYGKGEGKGGCLGGKDFQFMMVSIVLVSLSHRNNQGII